VLRACLAFAAQGDSSSSGLRTRFESAIARRVFVETGDSSAHQASASAFAVELRNLPEDQLLVHHHEEGLNDVPLAPQQVHCWAYCCS